MQLEGTGKWPNDAEAVEKMRAALGCEIAAALQAQCSTYTRAAETHVDVYVDGFALRLHLWSDRDETMADRARKVCYTFLWRLVAHGIVTTVSSSSSIAS